MLAASFDDLRTDFFDLLFYFLPVMTVRIGGHQTTELNRQTVDRPLIGSFAQTNRGTTKV
jgi:hypothetical protein